MIKDETVWFGKNFKRIRIKKGMSQGAIARSLGVGRSFITNIENGKTNLTLATIIRLAKALGITPDKLLK
jgi:transcriptional regulator with XRE-family HTH domain